MLKKQWQQQLTVLTQLDAAELANWNWWLKGSALAILFLLLVALGRELLIQERIAAHSNAVATEQQLLQGLRLKLTELRELPLLQTEVRDLQQRYKQQLTAFPPEIDMAGLLQDITEARLQAGLQGALFKPKAAQTNDKYVQLQVEVELRGSYSQLLNFVERLARLPRFVLLTISHLRPAETAELSMTAQLTAYAIPRNSVVLLDE